MNMISNAIAGKVIFYAFILKIIYTSITLGSGFKGGEIVPAMFVGATLGNVIGNIIGLDPGFSAAIGLICVFCGVTNCPISSIILSIELFPGTSVIIFGIACAISYLFSGYYSLYSSQKIMYAKEKPEYINLDAH